MLMAPTGHVGTQAVAASQALRPIRVLLVGDSTVTDDVGWGRGFKAGLSERVTCVNLARNGRSSKSYVDEGHWKAAALSAHLRTGRTQRQRKRSGGRVPDGDALAVASHRRSG